MKDGPVYETAYGFRELARAGVPESHILSYPAGSDISHVRHCFMAQALKETSAPHWIWIDSDIGFHLEDVLKLLSHDEPWVCGIYAQKRAGYGMACHFGEASVLKLGIRGGLTPLKSSGFGFMRTERVFIEELSKTMPECVSGNAVGPFSPIFMPMVHNGQYCSEDTSFCIRATAAGFKLQGDTSIRLEHIGRQRYSWEESYAHQPRFNAVELELSTGRIATGTDTEPRKVPTYLVG